MMRTTIFRLGGLVAVSLLLGPPVAAVSGAPAARADEPAVPDGITVLARGPIHEAFAQLATSGPLISMAVPKQAPAPIVEEPPDQQPEGATWVPGYWSWDSDSSSFIWVSGVWRVPPPGRQWVPGYWTQADNGWQWVSGFWADAQQSQIPYQPAPPAPLDNGPSAPAPDENSTYVPGVWVYRSAQYVWRPGYWQAARLGWVWTPASYCWTPSGYVYVSGFWDYPLDDRGLLFAPVAIDPPVVGAAFVYRPRYCIDIGGLLGSLFVRPGWGYYFGDFYGPAYVKAGWAPWITWGPRCFDPLFSYYRWWRGPGWCNGLNALYAGRLNGTLARPGRTLVAQNTLVQKNINNTTVVKDLRLVHSLNNVPNLRLTHLNRTQVLEHRTIAQNINRQRDDRLKFESARGRSLSAGLKLPASAHPVPRADLAGKVREGTSVQRLDHKTEVHTNQTVHTPVQPNVVHSAQPNVVHTPAQTHTVHTPTTQRTVPHVQARTVHQPTVSRQTFRASARPAPHPAAKAAARPAAKPASRPAGKKK